MWLAVGLNPIERVGFEIHTSRDPCSLMHLAVVKRKIDY